MLKDAELREAYIRDHPETIYSVACFTVPEAAKALGRTQLTLKRWIRDRLVPAPQLLGAINNYQHYSEGELQLIANILVEHEREYDYLHHTHTTTVNRLWYEVEQYRETYI